MADLSVVVYGRGKPWASPWLAALTDGFSRHGLRPQLRHADDVTDCDLAVFWGHKEDNIIARQRTRGAHYLVAEQGYLGPTARGVDLTEASLGFDGLNGRADFVAEGVGGLRWKRHAHLMAPRRHNPLGYVLICGQVPGDAALRGVDIDAWYATTARTLQVQGWDVRFRVHPQAAVAGPPGVAHAAGPLAFALGGAAFCVTFNSSAAVDAALAGVPVVACDEGSMAWDVAGHGISACAPDLPDRTDWAHRLAYAQWHIDEVSGGDAWDHLKRKFT